MPTSPRLASPSASRAFVLALVLVACCTSCIVEHAVTETPRAGFELVVQRGTQSPAPLVIARDGSTCHTLGEAISNVCVLVTYLDPNVIGGAALGRLNDVDTPSLTALIWRARVDGDVTVCGRGGLTGERRMRCEQAAQDPDYAMTAGDTTVMVPLAQAPMESAAPRTRPNPSIGMWSSGRCKGQCCPSPPTKSDWYDGCSTTAHWSNPS